jgi:hypothetical protein
VILKIKVNRMLVARKDKNLNKEIAIQISYFLNFGLFDMRNIIELKSVDGLFFFEIYLINYRFKKIYFLKSGELYFIDLNK